MLGIGQLGTTQLGDSGEELPLGFGQAQALIKTYGVNKHAQAQTLISKSAGYGQARAVNYKLTASNTVSPSGNYLVVVGQAETVLAGTALDVTVNQLIQLSWTIWTSEDRFGIAKTHILRLRRTDINGAVLASLSHQSGNDNTGGHIDSWISSYDDTAPTDGKYVITFQSTASTNDVAVYSDTRTFNIVSVPSKAFGQAQARIVGIGTNTGQAQANILIQNKVHAQAQALIRGGLAHGQAEAWIKATITVYGQSLAYIGHFQFGQSQAQIKQIYNGYGQSKAYIGHFKSGLAQGYVRAFDVEGYGQAAAQIVKSAGYGNAQGTIKATRGGFGQAQAVILPGNSTGQAQARTKQTYPLMSLDVNYALLSAGATASDSLGSPTTPSYTIDGEDYGPVWSITAAALGQYLQVDFNQQRTINYYRILPLTYDCTVAIQINTDPFPTHYNWVTVTTLPQFSVGVFDDVDTSRIVVGEFGPYTTNAVRVVVVDGGTFGGVALPSVEFGFATVKSPTFAQAQGFLGHFGVAQAQAYISPGFGITHGQANAQIVEVFVRRGQAQAFIIKPQMYGQAQASILQEYQQYAQVSAWIIPPTVIAQAQTTIKAFDVEGVGQANARIKQIYNRVANARAFITKTKGHGQAQALILSTRGRAFGQARARIGNMMLAQAQALIIVPQPRGFGQAKAQIKKTNNIRIGQAQAYIFKPFAHSQTLAQIKQIYQGYAQAGAIMNQTFALGQAQTTIEQIYVVSGQTQARLKNIATNFSKPYGQAQAVIKYRRYVHGQARAWINVRHVPTGQAMAFINSFKIGQAQARILAFNYPKTGQAQGYIRVNPVIPIPEPTSEAHTYLVRYNNYDLPGYAQDESYNSIERINQHFAKNIDGSLSEYLGLLNKNIVLKMRAWEPTYHLVKEKVQKAATMLRSSKNHFVKLYIQQPDAYFLALVEKVEIEKSVEESSKILDYTITFEAKPWLISNDIYEISGTGLIDTGSRTIYDGGWTPTKILVSGTDVEITATTESGDPAGHISIDGTCDNLVIDSENFTAIENGVNKNGIMLIKNYDIYVGPGKTFFQIDGATSCVIQYQNRWYLASTRRASTQPVATTPFPTLVVGQGFGTAKAYINSPTKQGRAQARAVIVDPIKKGFGQANAGITSPIKRAHAQARAFLRSGITWQFAQAGARIKTASGKGSGQSRAVIEGATKYKTAQARTFIKQHRKISMGQARATVIRVPVAPSNLIASPGDTEVTLTWS
jgi:hypothetical protein